ncbi:MAG: hypothetical protein AMXMBFR36_15700 [Acidobacteriota bacterium]
MSYLASAPFEDLGDAIAMSIFAASWIYAFVAHYALIGALRRRGASVSYLLWGSQLFLLQFEYLRSRGQSRESKLTWLARSAIVAPFIGLGTLLAAFVI